MSDQALLVQSSVSTSQSRASTWARPSFVSGSLSVANSSITSNSPFANGNLSKGPPTEKITASPASSPDATPVATPVTSPLSTPLYSTDPDDPLATPPTSIPPHYSPEPTTIPSQIPRGTSPLPSERQISRISDDRSCSAKKKKPPPPPPTTWKELRKQIDDDAEENQLSVRSRQFQDDAFRRVMYEFGGPSTNMKRADSGIPAPPVRRDTDDK